MSNVTPTLTPLSLYSLEADNTLTDFMENALVRSGFERHEVYAQVTYSNASSVYVHVETGCDHTDQEEADVCEDWTIGIASNSDALQVAFAERGYLVPASTIRRALRVSVSH
jgi:hypothetical protein